MTKTSLMASLLIVSFLSCKKETNTPDKPVAEHFPTKVGAYWVYHWYSLDSNGVETLLNQTDTVSVIGDTTLNGNTWAIYKETFFGMFPRIMYKRDSSGYIVDQNGQIVYSYVDFNKHFGEGSDPDIWKYYSKMVNNPDKIQVPAGSFTCVERRTVYYNDPPTPLTVCGDSVITMSFYYAPGVGEIKGETAYQFALKTKCERMERRLVAYFIP